VSGGHAGEPLPEDVEEALAKKQGRRKHKHVRVTTDPPLGSDPTPAPEPPRGSSTENDARLRADKPPHY
jgi:hypothetical protein